MQAGLTIGVLFPLRHSNSKTLGSTTVRSLRSAVVRIAPRFLITIYLRIRYPTRPTYNFGKPADIQSLPIDDVWEGEPTWRTFNETKFATVYAKRNDYISVEGYQGVLATMLTTQPSPPTIFDFGGATGIGYFSLQRQRHFIREWHIFDLTSESFSVQQELIDTEVIEFHDSNCFFDETYTQKLSKPNIIVCNTTLQYIDCLDDFVSSLLRLQPTYIVLSRFLATSSGLPALSVPQYQYGDRWRACTFHSVDELEHSLSPDYYLIQDSPITSEDLFPLVEKGFPTSLISRYSRLLLFRNTNPSP